MDWIFFSHPNLIHFTSVAALKSIINTKSLWLFNLNNLEDPREFTFAGNLLNHNYEYKSDAQLNLFLASFCKSNLLQGRVGDEFNMWQLYGDSGNGVCLEFDYQREAAIGWKDYFLGEIQYGTDAKSSFQKIKSLIEKGENEKPAIHVDLGQLVCFHKSNLYALEKEVRLVFDGRKDRPFHLTEYSNFDSVLTSPIFVTHNNTRETPDIIRHVILPIYNQCFTTVHSNIPLLKVKRIILGYGLKPRFNVIKQELEALSLEKLGYKVPVEDSRLTQFFYGTASSF